MGVCVCVPPPARHAEAIGFLWEGASPPPLYENVQLLVFLFIFQSSSESVDSPPVASSLKVTPVRERSNTMPAPLATPPAPPTELAKESTHGVSLRVHTNATGDPSRRKSGNLSSGPSSLSSPSSITPRTSVICRTLVCLVCI